MKIYPLQFPKNDHRSCREPTALTLDHLPRDGSLGEIKRATDSASDPAILPFSHEEPAQMAAISRSHVAITLNKFRERGFVRYERNRPPVVNVALLKKHFDG